MTRATTPKETISGTLKTDEEDGAEEEELDGNKVGGVAFRVGGFESDRGVGAGDGRERGGGGLFLLVLVARTTMTSFSPLSHRVLLPLMKKKGPDRPRSNTEYPPSSLR